MATTQITAPSHEATVESSKSERNRTVERQENVQKVNNFTEKQKSREEEAALKYYVSSALRHGCKCINVVRVFIINISNYHCQSTKQKNE